MCLQHLAQSKHDIDVTIYFLCVYADFAIQCFLFKVTDRVQSLIILIPQLAFPIACFLASINILHKTK